LKKLAKSIAIIALVSTLAIGTTKACFFSGSTSAQGNTFAAGVLDLEVNGRYGLTRVFSVTNLKPGADDFAGQVTLRNPSKIDGKAWLEIKKVRTTGNGALGNLVKASFRANGQTYGGITSIKDSQGVRVELFELPNKTSKPLALFAVWPNGLPTIDNHAQGQKTTFDVVFHLDQKM
jgi:hypothetical protein